jgi:RNA polymerase sigma-70 factor (ECF subfamily)
MNDFAIQFWPDLGRTTLSLTLAALVCGLMLRPKRPRSPLPHRVGWLATLLVGWSFLRLTVPVVWYDAPQPAEVRTIGGMVPTGMMKPALPGARPVDEVNSNSRPFAWAALAMMVWGLGMAAWIAAWLVSYARFLHRLPEKQAVAPDWEAQWRALLAEADVRRPIALRVTPNVGPLLCRRLRGYELMIPAALWRELTVGQREVILRHELAHYVRGDVWKSLAARALMLPHWFNPAAWWALRRFDEAAEWACDQAVVAHAPASSYAQLLLKLGEQVVSAGAPGVAARGGSLAVRIRRLLLAEGGQESKGKQATMIVAMCLTATLALLRVELVAKQPATQRGQAEESAQMAEATTILEQLAHSQDAAIAEAARHALAELRHRSPNRAPTTATADGETANASPVPPTHYGQFNVVPAPPDGRAYPSHPSYDPSRLYSGRSQRFRGPRGETFETDGTHLWRLDRDSREPWRNAIETQPMVPTAPLSGDFVVAENSDGAARAESSNDETGDLLQHDYGKSAGKRSIAGSGHAVRFESPDEDRVLTSVRIFGSRYGLPKAPNEDFHVWLCDEKMQALAQFDFPYGEFERGEPAWVTLKIKPTKVPKNFILCVGFNPEQTKGVYVHYDDQPTENSLTGLPGQEPKVFPTGNWMIRVTLSRPKFDRAE